MNCYLIFGDILRRQQIGKIALSLASLLFCFAGGMHCQTASPAAAPSSTPAQNVAPPVKHNRVRSPLPSTLVVQAKSQTVTLVGAGDIVGCENIAGAMATAKLIKQIPGTVFAAGDVVYEIGRASCRERVSPYV